MAADSPTRKTGKKGPSKLASSTAASRRRESANKRKYNRTQPFK